VSRKNLLYIPNDAMALASHPDVASMPTGFAPFNERRFRSPLLPGKNCDATPHAQRIDGDKVLGGRKQ
jgi:hypothetical protein